MDLTRSELLKCCVEMWQAFKFLNLTKNDFDATISLIKALNYYGRMELIYVSLHNKMNAHVGLQDLRFNNYYNKLLI